LALSSAASATTYLKNGTVGSTGTYNLSVTTDNTIGALSSGNVTAWNIAISDGSNNFTLNQGNSAFLTTGGLSATATDLLFDFSASGSAFALFQNPTTSSGGPYFCWQSNGCFDFLGGGIGLAPTSNYSNQQITRLQGSLVVASVAGGVPEPGTWAMMLLGFAGIGMAVRRSRRSMRTRVAA
jgi:hypothetical protein